MFLVFAGDNYYPEGGWKDFVGSYSKLEEAKQGVLEMVKASGKWHHGLDCIHIVNLNNGCIVVNTYAATDFEFREVRQ